MDPGSRTPAIHTGSKLSHLVGPVFVSASVTHFTVSVQELTSLHLVRLGWTDNTLWIYFGLCFVSLHLKHRNGTRLQRELETSGHSKKWMKPILRGKHLAKETLCGEAGVVVGV